MHHYYCLHNPQVRNPPLPFPLFLACSSRILTVAMDQDIRMLWKSLQFKHCNVLNNWNNGEQLTYCSHSFLGKFSCGMGVYVLKGVTLKYI